MSEEVVQGGIKRSPEAQTDDDLPSPKRPEYDEVQEVTVDAEISLPTTEVATEQDSTGVMITRGDSPTNSFSNVSGQMYSPQNMVNFQTSPAAISNALEMLMQMQQAFNQKMGQQGGSQQAQSPGQSGGQDSAESGGQSSGERQSGAGGVCGGGRGALDRLQTVHECGTSDVMVCFGVSCTVTRL